MPLILVGSLFIILTNLPIKGWDTVSSLGIGPWANRIVNGSFGIMGLVASFWNCKKFSR